MQRKYGSALLAGSMLAVGVPLTAFAFPGTAIAAPSLKICVAEGGGDIVVSGPSNTDFDTGRMQATVSGTDNLTYSSASGYSGSYTVTTTPTCATATALKAGDYTAYAANQLDGPCYRTVNGELVNPPYIVGSSTDPSKTPRCAGKVYEIQMTVDGNPAPPSSIHHQDSLSFYYTGYSSVVITFRITDKRLFDCVSQTGGQGASGTTLGSPNNNSTVCEPNGPTQNP